MITSHNSTAFKAVVALVSLDTRLSNRSALNYCISYTNFIANEYKEEVPIEQIARKVINKMNINSHVFKKFIDDIKLEKEYEKNEFKEITTLKFFHKKQSRQNNSEKGKTKTPSPKVYDLPDKRILFSNR